jgi:hypothetical protein
MPNLSPVLASLKTEQQRLRSELAALDQAISTLAGLDGASRSGPRRGRRRISAAARRRIAAAQKARWAKWKAKRGKK